MLRKLRFRFHIAVQSSKRESERERQGRPFVLGTLAHKVSDNSFEHYLQPPSPTFLPLGCCTALSGIPHPPHTSISFQTRTTRKSRHETPESPTAAHTADRAGDGTLSKLSS